MERKYQYPVYHTQGGGLVRSIGDSYIFVEKPPDVMGLDVGDEMPEMWGVVPANALAELEFEKYAPWRLS